MKFLSAGCGVFFLLISAGCDSSSEPGSGSGELQITLVDAPAAYDAVTIAVASVAVHTSASAAGGDAGWTVINETPADYDLLDLRNGVSEVLGRSQLPAAHYTQIRLMIGAGSTVTVDGVSYPLQIPSGIQSGLKLTHAFTIEEDKLYELTLDFDAERSVRPLGGTAFRLDPTIRVIAAVTSGTISGIVQPDSVHAVVYAYSGTDTIATAYADTVTGAFKLMALPVGFYNVSAHSTIGPFISHTRTGVAVAQQQDNDLGMITLE